MTLSVYNSLTKKVEPFVSLKDRQVNFYTCGPTVYGYQHVGNFRSYISWDMVKKTLEFLDYRVNHVMNITDVGHLTDDDVLASDAGEDKMEKAAKREEKTVWDIAAYYEKDFLEGLEALHVKRPSTICRATEHIEPMIKMIEDLLAKGYAYVTPTGVYFNIMKFHGYGMLSGNTLDQLDAGASGRVEDREEKHSPHDFVLWVLGKEQSMMWDSPWGRGYPGWHIECSAMSRQYLGDQIDIHSGGLDNKFPHHECEIAQSEGASGKRPFVKYWIHGGLITVDGQKMAKSKGNVLLLKDLPAKGFSIRAFRMMCLLTHYRNAMDVSDKSLDQASKNCQMLDRLIERLRLLKGEGGVSRETSQMINDILQEVMDALCNDFHTPEALAVIFRFAKDLNRLLDENALSHTEGQALVSFFETLDYPLGVLLSWGDALSQEIPSEIMAMVEQRTQAKGKKDFAEADRLRDMILEKGYVIEDTKDGVVVKSIGSNVA